MNKVILMGRLTRDPDVRTTAGENPTMVARYTLAVDRRFKREGEQSADFISCVVFGKGAEFANNYLRQGTKIAITGRLQTGSYERDGQKVYTTDVVVEEHEFAESKDASSNSGNSMRTSTTPATVTTPSPQVVSADNFVNIPDGIDEELPFN